MQSFLSYERSRYPNRWLDILASDGGAQTIIKRWCKNPRLRIKAELPPSLARAASIDGPLPDGVKPREDWEVRLWFLANHFELYRELSGWETASFDERSAHSKRVARLARDLANALEETPRPHYPPALALLISVL
ncbi:MAG: hypothetical protein U1F68_14255 [Gammaproteobacteria bacterium]